MTKSFELKGKNAFVTGANRGIGKSIVEAMLKNGVNKVYAGVRDLKSLSPLVKQYGEKIVPIHLDLEDPETIEQAAERATDVTIVVNNAGVFRSGSPMDEDAIESLQYELDINVFGLMRVAQAFAPIISANGGGILVQLNSIASLKCVSSNFATYCASKAAAYSITQGLREALAKQNIRVLSVHPGPINTEMAIEAGLTGGAHPDVVAQGVIKAIGTGQFHLFPDRIANQIGTAYQSFAHDVVEAQMTLEG